jgi:hypothetical protein
VVECRWEVGVVDCMTAGVRIYGVDCRGGGESRVRWSMLEGMLSVVKTRGRGSVWLTRALVVM